MQKLYTPARIVFIFLVLAVALTVYVSAMYRIQVYHPRIGEDGQVRQREITRTSTIAAARGNICDRNGVLLASGRPSYNIRLDWSALRGMPDANDAVKELIYAAMDEGIPYNDTFPVTRGAPFEFLANMTSTQENRLNAYFEYFRIDPDIAVSDFLAWLHQHYSIDYTVGILDARLIIGVRYELEIRAIMGNITPYIFASDVSTDFVSYIEERGLTGVYTESTYIREYHTSHAPHILGYIGAMTAEEYEVYKERGYPMDAIVGKVGAELAFEEELHGVAGRQTMRFNEDGTVLGFEINKLPEPGNHIHLTVDLDLQIATEHALRTQIETINARREATEIKEGDDELDLIPGGAVVVVDVNTGEVLASASYPTFSLLTLSEDWSQLNTDPNFPMLNRATHGRYSPGSTFKMITGLAALRHIGIVTRYFPINDPGRFTKYEDYGLILSCWIYPEHRVGHGDLDIVQALECSCNYYFLQVSDWFPGGARGGADILAETSREFGLGINTGIELPESSGRLALPEVKFEVLGETGWYYGDTLTAGFGQGLNRFTPIQLANYSATIANDGKLQRLSFLRRVSDPNFGSLHEHEPEVLNQISDLDNLEIIQEGMRAVTKGNRGTAKSVFGNYRIPVAAKTGTVQIEGALVNDGVFVCYAPANNPEIAISIVVEKGGSGSAIMDIARMIFDHYFVTESTIQATPYGTMVP